MANVKRTVLGVEIGAREVRLVEMRGGNPPQILKAGAVPLPAGAMDGDRVVQVDAIADIIRGLHQKLGCQSRSAVVGMGVQSVVTRILAIPRVPDSELRVVLEGELAHYQILRAGTGAFDFFRLDTSATTDDTLPSVLLMAVEDRIAQGYRLAVEKAGLQMLALEPITLSLFRAAYPVLTDEPAALCLAVTPQRSELSILDHGQIRLYRRLELGSNDFVRGRKASSGFGGGPINLTGDTAPVAEASTSDYRAPRIRLNTEEDEDTAELEPIQLPPGATGGAGTGPLPPLGGGGNTGKIIPQAAASLANEVQRSLDYYRREFPNATAISRIILPTNDPDAEALSEFLSDTLRMDVRVAEPPTDPNLPRQTLILLEAPQGLQFLGAVGLAMQALTPDWKQVPRFNLSIGGQAAVVPVERDRLTAVMIMAVCILIGGFFFGMIIGRNAQGENDRLKRLQETLGLKQKDYNALAEAVRDEKILNWIIKSDNLPVLPLLDQLTKRLPPEVGLTNVQIQRNGHILLEGDARDIGYFNTYYFGLMSCPYFVSPRYQSLVTDSTSHITHFKIETSLKGTQDALNNRAGAF